jgi:deoxyribodipyrimidine photo-lyase
MNPDRIQWLHQSPSDGDYILYWMQQSMRVNYNHALEFAVQLANKHHLPLVVYFGLTPQYPGANLRHYTFLLEGLEEVVRELHERGIGVVFKFASPEVGIRELLPGAHTLVMDFGYLKKPRQWRKAVFHEAKQQSLPTVIVESDVIVPVRVTSDKQEYAAATIRRKVWKHVAAFDDWQGNTPVDVPYALSLSSDAFVSEWRTFIHQLGIDDSVKPSPLYRGGYMQALKRLDTYLSQVIFNDQPMSSDPADDISSKLSMYLHFGQISSLEIMNQTAEYPGDRTPQMQANIDSFLEQLIVRRELAFNYCYYNQGYDVFETMTEPWAYKTMEEHASDVREYVYSLEQLEQCQTHDFYWNAAMLEMVTTGFMHNYMRMYWAKKIIEWSPSFKEAFDRTVYLDDKYFLDGRDPNGYTGVAWCYGKHDRAWTERAIFGKLRYMNAAGLERKFRIKDYANRWQTFAKSLQ